MEFNHKSKKCDMNNAKIIAGLCGGFYTVLCVVMDTAVLAFKFQGVAT